MKTPAPWKMELSTAGVSARAPAVSAHAHARAARRATARTTAEPARGLRQAPWADRPIFRGTRADASRRTLADPPSRPRRLARDRRRGARTRPRLQAEPR